MELLETISANSQQAFPSGSFLAEPKPFSCPKTVLLAEDDPDLRYVMECTLTIMGYLVVACPDAYAAMSAFHSKIAIDILLTDFEMPNRTGLELAREITAACPSLPVMIITGSSLSSEMMREIRERHWVYVSKPCRLSELQATLKALLRPEMQDAA